MRNLEHNLAHARSAFRRTMARFGRTDPSKVEPARLVVRMDDADLPGVLGTGEAWGLADWERAIVLATEWLGPIPVTVLAGSKADHPLIGDIVRFAHRLECDTELVSDGTGVDRERANDLVDRGLGRARVWVGGVAEDVHRAVVGNTTVEATSAVLAFIEAKRDRGAALDVEVALPWQGPADAEARAVLGWARQIGADGFRIVAPWKCERMPADPELLDELGSEPPPLNRTQPAAVAEIHTMVASRDGGPGAPLTSLGGRRLRRFRCPVGGQRLEVTSNGCVYCCPFKSPIGTIPAGATHGQATFSRTPRADGRAPHEAKLQGQGELRDLWNGAGPHLAAIAACDRACAHVELAPAPVLG